MARSCGLFTLGERAAAPLSPLFASAPAFALYCPPSLRNRLSAQYPFSVHIHSVLSLLPVLVIGVRYCFLSVSLVTSAPEIDRLYEYALLLNAPGAAICISTTLSAP